MRLRVTSLSLGLLLAASTALAGEAPFLLSADEISYDTVNNTVTAAGNIEILSGHGAVQAQRITYNQQTDILTAEGDVLYLNPQDVAVYADRLELEGSLKTGAIEQLRIRLKNNGPALTAARAVKRSETVYALEQTAYSACPACEKGDDGMPWKIRADDISYNAETEIISYKNAVMDVYGLPVAWVPKFSHTVSPNTPKSGLLPPRFGRSGSRGEEMTVAYYHHVHDGLDYTLRNRYMARRGAQLVGENRYAGRHLTSEFRGSMIADQSTASVRSHLDGSGEYVVSPGNRAGLALQLASDDTYYDDYLGNNPSYLKNNAYAESASPLHYAAFTSTFYQETRDGRPAKQTAQPLAQGQLERTFVLDDNVSQVTLSGNALGLHRSDGVRYRRIVAQSSFIKPWMTSEGDLLEFNASLRGDLYNVDGVGGGESLKTRGLPSASMMWQRPYVSQGGNHTIIPQAMVIASPRGGNPNDIPNEDSVAYELDASNLFDDSRFAGYDRVETGPRFIYGIDNQYGPGGGTTRYRLFLGQSIRFHDDSTLPALGGTENQDSDWVGFASMNPTNWLGIGSRFRLDNADLTTRRLDNAVTLGNVTRSYLTVGYTFLDGGPEEVNTRSRIYLGEQTYVDSQIRRDLADDGRLLVANAGLTYIHDCYKMSLSVRRRGFSNRNVPPSTDYMFNIELLSLGRALD